MKPQRSHNRFAGVYVDRDSGLRRDAGFLAAALEDPQTRFVPVAGTLSLVRATGERGAVLLTRAALPDLAPGEAILLGRFRGDAVFAVELPADAADAAPPGSAYVDLRIAAADLADDEAGLLAYARALVYWRARHRFCGACGSATVARDGGHVMTCTNTACASEFFPRIDPAIIVLVADGERALLGRQASWPAGRYSTIAGFVEPGESFEDAVAREVREETGVEIGAVTYHSSQPWPFPSSVMIGFVAEAVTRAVHCPDGELEDARWFTPAEVASGTPALPSPTSISFRLIADWYEARTGRRLESEPGIATWSRGRPGRG